MSNRGFFITGTDTDVGKTVFTCQLARALLAVGRTSLSVPSSTDKDVRPTTAVAAYKPVCSGAVFLEIRPAHPDPLPHSGVSSAYGAQREGEGADLDGDAANLKADARSATPVWSDVESLYAATNAAFPRDRLCPQTFLAPLSPPEAAALEGREVDESLLIAGYQWLAERAKMVLVEGAGGFYSPISTNWLNADLAERIGLPVLIVAPNRLGTINQTLLTIEAARRRGLLVAGVVLNCLSEAGDASTSTNAAEIRSRGQVTVWDEIPFLAPAELQRSCLPESMICGLRNFGCGASG